MRRETLYNAAVFLTVLYPVLFIAGGVATDSALSVLAALFLVHSYLEKDWQWLRMGWVRALCLLWIYILLRSLFTEHPWDALRKSLPFPRYFLFAAALGCWTLKDARVRRWLLLSLTAVVLFSAVDGLIQWLFGLDLFLRPLVLQAKGSFFRLTGPFSGQILGIMLAWLSFPACLFLLFTEEGALKRDNRFAERLLIVLAVQAAVVFSNERVALLFLLLGWAIAILILPVKKRYPLAAMLAGMLILAVGAAFNPSILDRQVFSILDILQHWWTSPYGMLLTSDLKALALNPVFGIGLSHFRLVCPGFYPGLAPTELDQYCNLHPHNIYLEWLIESGVIGFTLYLAFLGLVVRECVKAWPRQRHNPVFAGFLIAFILRLWPIASSTSFFSHWGAPPFWLALGALIAYTAAGKSQGKRVC